MAQAVDVFRRNMIETRSLRESQEADKQRSEGEKQALQKKMADRFEADVKGLVGAVAQGHRAYAARSLRDHHERRRHI